MRLQRLWLKQFRNLRDVTVDFAEYYEPSTRQPANTERKPIRSHALIGQNGTGKSNMMEALITIFRNIDLDLPATFDYELDYQIRDNKIKITADTVNQNRPFVWVNGEKQSQGFLLKNDYEYLPAHIFAYYSGKNDRIEALFQTHQERYKNILQQDKDDLVRRLFYFRGGHSQLVLLSCLLSNDTEFKKLLGNLGIESIESANFVLKKPHALKDLSDNDLLQGDPRFWYARGTVVNNLLNELWKVAWAPIQETCSVTIDFRRRPEKQELMYLFVPDQATLEQLGEMVGTPERFFRYAEAAYIGDLLEEVRITVKKRGADGCISFKQLSEGELQMLTVLGLMRITRQDQCLFLLDEPDTHLNPIWKLRYFDDIEKILGVDSSENQVGESQILITTHDPIMVGSLRREQVHILRKQNHKTVIEQPGEHPQGMGVTGLLKSELFGLSSTLDPETERRLYRRNELFAIGDSRTVSQDEELSYLSAELADLGFSSSDFKDPVYALFAKKMAQHKRLKTPPATPAERAEQDAIADAIIDEILKES
ncbi:MAG: AAA family ATPase [Thiolinea sp.]|mgnify:CR=1 FL=1